MLTRSNGLTNETDNHNVSAYETAMMSKESSGGMWFNIGIVFVTG